MYGDSEVGSTKGVCANVVFHPRDKPLRPFGYPLSFVMPSSFPIAPLVPVVGASLGY